MANYCPCCMAQIDSELSGKCTACGAELTLENRPHQLPVMTILRGRYLVGRVLGEGGFGITYIGRDLVLNQRVAIKEFYPSGSAARHSTTSLAVHSISEADDEIIEKGRSGFLKEAQAIARFRDVPSVVNVNDFFMENGTSYIVMEYLDGQSLQQWLKEKGPVRDFGTLYEMLRPVMDGLEKVHQAGIIHRDISPSNLMMNGSGEIKILDFGTARGFGQDNEKSLSVVLKPGFAPVEQYRKHGKQGPWTDVYALCATIYKLLTGVTPESSVDRMMEDTLNPPSALGAIITPKQEKALMAGLAVDPEKRTRSVAQLIKELDAGGKKKKSKGPTTKKDTGAEADAETKAKAREEAKAEAKAEKEAKKEAERKNTVDAEVKADTDNKETSKPETKKKKPKSFIPLAVAAAIILAVLLFVPGKDEGKKEEPVPLPSPAATQETEEATPTKKVLEHKIVQVFAGTGRITALCSNGYVHIGDNNANGHAFTENWNDIVKTVSSGYYTYALKKDGKVLTDEENSDVSEWENIIDIDIHSATVIGLKSDGTVVTSADSSRTGVDAMKDITMVSAGMSHYLGLTASGTVIATGGKNSYGERDVGQWTDIVSIDAGDYHSVGLRADGTVVAVGANLDHQCDVSSWENIVAISAGSYSTIGLKKDGSVVETGFRSTTSGWRDVAAISASSNVIAALTSDGRILTSGKYYLDERVCNHEPKETNEAAPAEETTPEPVPETKSPQRTVLHSGDIGDRITWELDSEGVLTIDGSGLTTNYNDTSRRAPWFEFRDSIEGVVISGEITSVPEYAFAGCSNLKSVSLSQSITEIGIRAFSECGQLESIELPSGVTNIGGGAFYNCKMLSDISLGDSVRKIRGYAFFGCGSLNHITLPGTLVEIEEYAFYGCNKLDSIFFNGYRWGAVIVGDGNYPFGDVRVGTLGQ